MRVSKWMMVTLTVALVLVMYFQFSTGHQFEGETNQIEGFRDGRVGGSRPGGGGFGSRPGGGGFGSRPRGGGFGSRPGGGGFGSRPGGGGHHRPGGDYSAHARPGGDSYGWWPSYWWPYYDYLWFPSCDLTGCPDDYVCAKDPETGYSYCV